MRTLLPTLPNSYLTVPIAKSVLPHPPPCPIDGIKCDRIHSVVTLDSILKNRRYARTENILTQLPTQVCY